MVLGLRQGWLGAPFSTGEVDSTCRAASFAKGEEHYAVWNSQLVRLTSSSLLSNGDGQDLHFTHIADLADIQRGFCRHTLLRV